MGRTSKRSKFNIPTRQHFDVDLNSTEDEISETRECEPVLPMGRDQAKRKAKASSSTSTTNTASSEELVELKDEFAELRGSLEKHMQFTLDRTRDINARAERNERLKAFEIFMTNVSHLTGEDYEAAMKMKQELKQTYGF